MKVRINVKWEQHKLGDFGNVQMNKRIFKSQTLDSGDVPFYKIGTFGKKADAYISSELYEEYRNKYPYPKDGDLLISASGSIGKIVEYKGQKAYYQDSNIVWLDHDNRILNLFLKAFFQIVKWNGTEGSTIKRLYNKNILNTEIILPKIKEQTAVGKLIEKVDYLITLQQRKLRQLKQLKMVMLQQLFVDKNNQQPNLRFKKFNGDWELHKLGDVILDYKKKNNNDLLPVLTSSFQGIEYQEKHFGSKQKHDTSDYNVLPKEYMTYRNRSDNGYFRFNINKLGITGIVSKFYPVFTTINTNKQFLASYLNYNPRLKNYFKVVSVGTSQHVLSLKNLKKTNLLFPSKSEQDQIGYFFNLLNKIIFLQQNKLTQLTTLKKYLLQKMFI
ncbi:restriction endonuclease subunit S [Limosilactobacillus reuteri]|uniref:restriction endonuclease subunit S n=2 Tax=Limosilactobacillus reuteri TaxID=1598 RepID=UPI003AEFCD6E